MDELVSILESLENRAFNANNKDYVKLYDAIICCETLDEPIIRRTLKACGEVMVHDIAHSARTVHIICHILKILEENKNIIIEPEIFLKPCVGVLKMLYKITKLQKAETMLNITFSTLLQFPPKTLAALVSSHSPLLMEIILFLNNPKNVENMSKSIQIISKLLTVLPPENKSQFVADNIDFWFSQLLPSIMQLQILSPKPDQEILELSVDCLELLAHELVPINYSANKSWENILRNFTKPNSFPSILKTLLDSESNYWHRLWIVFVKLLKKQITKCSAIKGSSPINSMLPVVEAAFKTCLLNRCRAFQCWSVLIENFSKMENESQMTKMVKLLMVPLISNNAKVEITALAKLYTWVDLLHYFEPKMETFGASVIIPFLRFCFGSRNNSNGFVPGLITDKLKLACLEKFSDIAGHLHCTSCEPKTKYRNSLITVKLLVDHWDDWLHFVKKAISLTTVDPKQSGPLIKCAWKSFLSIIGDLPDNSVRQDLFLDVIKLLSQLVQETDNNDLQDFIIQDLICSMFEDTDKIKGLLKANDGIINILLDEKLENFYKRYDVEKCVNTLRPISFFIANNLANNKDVITYLLETTNDRALVIWTAFSKSLLDITGGAVDLLTQFLVWPLKYMENFSLIHQYTAESWYFLYNTQQLKSLGQQINALVLAEDNVTEANKFLLFYAVIAAIRTKINRKIPIDYSSELELFYKVLHKLEYSEFLERIQPILIDIVVMMVDKVSNIQKLSIKLAEPTLNIAKQVLKLISQLTKQNNVTSIFVDNLMKSILELLQTHSDLKQILANDVIEYKNVFSSVPSFLTLEELCSSSVIQPVVSNNVENNNSTPKVNDTFCAPVTFSKKPKKEAKIEKTVVENGEEYVVVKSNWKFNPRKLTENQKEKFQRKREDIPALYQDLSQSQDEFKLSTWKTDSQDTTTSVSKSSDATNKSNNNNENPNGNIIVLKNMPSAELVSNIIDNIKTGTTDADSKLAAKITNTESNTEIKVSKVSSPRIALKDRVFRNVKNLMEKSGTRNQIKDANPNLNQTVNENVLNTPNNKLLIPDVVNSAPAKITAERPSRVKRQPKKFENTQLYALKKKRQGLLQNDSQSDNEINDNPLEIKKQCKLNLNKGSVPSEVTINLPDQNITNHSSSESKNNLEENSSVNKVTHDEVKDDKIALIDVTLNNSVTQPTPTEQVPEIKTSVENITSKTPLLDTTNCQTESGPSNPAKIEIIEDKAVECLTLTQNIDGALTQSQDINSLPDNQCLDSPLTSKHMSTPINKSENHVNKKSTTKKSSVKKSRIEKELAIDMVAGHPFLTTPSEKRTRRKIMVLTPTTKRKYASDKNKSKNDDKLIENKKSEVVTSSSGESEHNSFENLPESEDVIESSQDSTMTTISVKSNKTLGSKVPIVALENVCLNKNNILANSQSLLDNTDIVNEFSKNNTNEDIDLPANKTVTQEESKLDSTEMMDTQPIDSSEDVIFINDDDDEPIVIHSENTNVTVGPETQELADADTEPMDIELKSVHSINITSQETDKDEIRDTSETIAEKRETSNNQTHISMLQSSNISAIEQKDSTGLSSPFKDDVKRKKDFLNDTFEISPIKNLSPVRDQRTPSPETSNDYVVIKLTSPVQSNGEPYDKTNSPEVFTEDKISPNKRDASPPRVEVPVNITSPSSALSLKKNRSQVRPSGRAAHMLGLCVPNKLNSMINLDKSAESEDSKKSGSLNITARRNLRILYNVGGNEEVEGNEDSENFLKLNRVLPDVDSSPVGPILKRKHIDITDEATVSPASKRKRVSFQDPPVSVTMSVHKYIEPLGLRSPQNSAAKRQERILRSQNMKSPKRLDSVFKLDNALIKTVESFVDTSDSLNTTDDTEMSSLEQTPAVEIVKNSDFNDVDPICPELVDCLDPFDNIAAKLSSPAMKDLLVKELEGKIETVGDLAKLTELEVNRLCIMAPKVKIAKKVLTDYASTRIVDACIEEDLAVDNVIEITEEKTQSVVQKVDIEVQTNIIIKKEVEIQTMATPVNFVGTQTDIASTSSVSVQTNESGERSTKELVAAGIKRQDFIEELHTQLDDDSIKRLIDNLRANALMDNLKNQVTDILDRIVDRSDATANGQKGDQPLLFLINYLCNKFDSRQLILLCSQLLQKVHDKPDQL